ncbi:MAG: HAMP domain-containing histidine kinase [Bacteroidales bacterium]|nr:HAMP domain-containing histidine kinase [Bacteroidales bacterium]
MSNRNIRIIIILGIIAIASVLVLQIYLLRKAWRLEEDKLNQRLHSALNSTSERVITFNNSSLSPQEKVKQLAPGYFVVNTNSEVEKSVLEYFLKLSFNEFNVSLNFEYAIYNCYYDTMEYVNRVIYNPEESEFDEPAKFLKSKEFMNYFGIYFPGIQSYLWRELSVVMIFSFAVVLIAIFFGYAITIILRQNRLSELQREFINTMTHEFKTPISTINIAADVLANTEILKTPERLVNYSNLIKQENTRLNSQVERVLQLARLEKKNFGLNKELLNLNELIRNVCESFEMNAEKQNFSIRYHLNAGFSDILADRLHLTNMLFNLIDNAIKYRKDELLITVTTHNFNTNIIMKLKIQVLESVANISPKYLTCFIGYLQGTCTM